MVKQENQKNIWILVGCIIAILGLFAVSWSGFSEITGGIIVSPQIVVLKYALIAVLAYGLMVFRGEEAEEKKEERKREIGGYIIDTCYLENASTPKYRKTHPIPRDAPIFMPPKTYGEAKRRERKGNINYSIFKSIKPAKIPQGLGMVLKDYKDLVQKVADDIWQKQKGELKDRLSPEDRDSLAYKYILEAETGKEWIVKTDDKLIIETEKTLEDPASEHHKYLVELKRTREKQKK